MVKSGEDSFGFAGVQPMPIYEFYCEACEKSFDQMTTMGSRDMKVPCPACGSKKTGRKLSVVAVGASGGQPSTGGGHVHSGMCGCGKVRGSCGGNN
jgi:putative FmdB family regulatory protein